VYINNKDDAFTFKLKYRNSYIPSIVISLNINNIHHLDKAASRNDMTQFLSTVPTYSHDDKTDLKSESWTSTCTVIITCPLFHEN